MVGLRGPWCKSHSCQTRLGLIPGHAQPTMYIVYKEMSDKDLIKTQLIACNAPNCSDTGCVLASIPSAVMVI